MSIEFLLPDIGEGIVECELLEWLVEEGQHIVEDQPVAEVMTDKATVQIPAMHAGTVEKLHYRQGEIARVHQPLFSLVPEAEQVPENSEADSDYPPAVQPDSAQSYESTFVDKKGHMEDFILPDIGEGIVECEVVKWHVHEGDFIEEDQPVVEVMTDKAVVEIPAKHAGKVMHLYYQQGDIAAVHQPLFSLKREDGLAEAEVELATEQKAKAGSVKKAAVTGWPDGAFEPPVVIPGKVIASPAVRRVAREANIDLAQVQGSGKKGRILKADVHTSAMAENTQSKAQESVEWTEAPRDSGVRTEKVRGIQAAMARQMSASVHTIPHFTVSDEVVMDSLIQLRNALKPEFERKGLRLSFMPFFIKALSLALREFPIINSQLNDSATELSYFDDHNIGFAVDTPNGLLVPNIKQVQTLSLMQIAEHMQRIVEAAREGRIAGEDLKGGTITISNIGAIGGITATPVINKPEAAIVALGKTQTLPRFNTSGEVIAQNIMMVNWSGDHRIIDGATMVKFNNLWCHYLTHPSQMLMHLS
ncbi:dihydrolipoyllysine-residue acetyltransferase [Alteromonas aestuariivivens]|uniref:Dihydrolipoamide acetyltransferase component of pyruvate dehydrogenase complex n=1 Tax=Alteromonas aestuariivivens TaxID=1938339 RepID=A0A3D8M839_9ALTE|nr:dihydrolipoyllysine-residue acetyltransferase [Alteromonas aestuariivivens]RDV25984.1 dihydrolipoyllysine-residue acetyltransferase [Alteromonas aestuariivivens]